jgi:hypothetical protein
MSRSKAEGGQTTTWDTKTLAGEKTLRNQTTSRQTGDASPQLSDGPTERRQGVGVGMETDRMSNKGN